MVGQFERSFQHQHKHISWIRYDLQMQRIHQHKLSRNHTSSLKVYGLPAVIFQVLHHHHCGINQLRDLREGPFEGCEEGRIIESPL